MRRQVIVAVVVAVLVAVAFTMVLIRPKMAEVTEVRGRVESESREEIRLRAQLAQLRQAQRDAPAIQARLARFELLLPSTPDLPSFIRQVQGAANADGVDLTSIAPSPPTALTAQGSASGVSTISVTLNVGGGFFRMQSFLARLEELQRVVEVRTMSLTPTIEDTGERSLTGTITLLMYVAEPGARPPTAALPGATPSPTPTPTPTGGAAR